MTPVLRISRAANSTDDRINRQSGFRRRFAGPASSSIIDRTSSTVFVCVAADSKEMRIRRRASATSTAPGLAGAFVRGTGRPTRSAQPIRLAGSGRRSSMAVTSTEFAMLMNIKPLNVQVLTGRRLGHHTCRSRRVGPRSRIRAGALMTSSQRPVSRRVTLVGFWFASKRGPPGRAGLRRTQRSRSERLWSRSPEAETR
jgi:hypothetical protein